MSDIWMDVDIALASVPVNRMPLIDDTDFVSIEAAVVFNQAGLALFWNFTTTAGVTTVVAVTPTSAGVYDWTDFSTSGMYGIEIPASGGASANNDTEGVGYFTGVATGILPWRGPSIGFRDAALNNLLIDDALSATRGLAGTALPAAAANAAGGLPISAAGALALDTQLANTNEITAARMGALTDWINGGRLDLLLDDVLARIPATLVAGRMDASVGAMAANVLTAAAINSAAITASKFGVGAIDAAAISADFTDEVMADWENGGRLDLILDAILVDTDVIGALGAGLTDLGGMSSGMQAEVNAEVVDVMFTDTDAEPGQGTPGATISLADKIGYLYKAWRNRSTQDATTYNLYNDNATTVDQTAAVSDNATTADKGEVATGP